MAKLLDRYVLREVAPPFLIGLLLVSFVLLMNQVLLLADLFIAKGVPALLALRVLGMLVPSILVFALPMAVLMGVLGGLARLSADSEIVALRSLGVGPRRLARPLLLFGLGGLLLTLPLALCLAPRANHAWVRAMTETVLNRVRLEVEPLEFDQTLPGTVFLVRDVERDGTWREVFAYLDGDPAGPRLVLAKSGTVRFYPEMRRAVLELADGLVYSEPVAATGEDTLTAFERLEEEIDVERLFAAGSMEKRVREKDIGELVRDLETLTAVRAAGRADPRQLRAHRIEIHKKLALPAACLVFALLGLPLGVITGRAGRTGGFSLGLVIILVYYVLLTAGEKAAMDGRVSAFLGMWGPDIFLAALALPLLARPVRGRIASRLRPPRPRAAPSPAATSAAAAAPGRRRRRVPLSVRLPGLLDRYVSRKFLVLLALVLAALTAAAFLATFFESLNEVLQRGKPVGLLVRYVWFKVPGFLAFLLPVAVLTAALLGLGFLARTNEATAMKASGVSAYRTALPVLVLAAVAGGLVFLVQERVVPASEARAEAAWSALMDLPPRSASYLNRNWVLAGGGDRIYHYDYFEPGTSTFGRLSVFEIDTRSWALARRTYAERAWFDGDDLALRDGWTRDYGESPGPRFARRPEGRLEASGDRDAFLTPLQEPPQMSYRDLRRYVSEVRAMGFPAVRLRAELARKTALPFVGLVMALLAVPFGSWMGRKGALVGVGLSVVIAMVYWGAFAVFRSLGAAGALPPFLGAWGANILFGSAGLVGFLRIRT
ncbi:MAG TPA: YjgP/YjgQ family permease [Candidatus Aminicenantes bacterium]|nr:YjgP/YjgQ family permease [Candidatus Aminicenantes bacterium]